MTDFTFPKVLQMLWNWIKLVNCPSAPSLLLHNTCCVYVCVCVCVCFLFQGHTNALGDLRCGAWELEGTGTSTDEGSRNTGEIRILHADSTPASTWTLSLCYSPTLPPLSSWVGIPDPQGDWWKVNLHTYLLSMFSCWLRELGCVHEFGK